MSEMSEMLTSLREVIAAHLPAQVGDFLRERLEQLEATEVEVKDLRAKVNNIKADRDEKCALLAKYTEIDKRMAELGSTERIVEAKLLRQEMNELRVSEAQKRAQDMKEIVALVFQNNRFKYTESGTEHIPVSKDSWTNPVTRNRDVTGEG